MWLRGDPTNSLGRKVRCRWGPGRVSLWGVLGSLSGGWVAEARYCGIGQQTPLNGSGV